MSDELPVPAVGRLSALDETAIAELSAVLVDCVQDGASVGFMQPLDLQRAASFWRGIAPEVAAGDRVLLVARDGQGIVGTVQVILDRADNKLHRADVAKMLVHRRGRRRGLGSALLRAAEAAARAEARTLLVLDTATGSDAERLYTRHGWVRAGIIPDYALWPQGGLCSTSIYYRRLG